MDANVLDLGPLALEFLDILAALLVCLGGYAVKVFRDFLKEKTGIEIQAQYIETVQSALEKGVQYGMAKVRPLAADRAKVDIENDLLFHAANYVVKQVPDALAGLGITKEQVCEMVMARIEDTKPNDVVAPGPAPSPALR